MSDSELPRGDPLVKHSHLAATAESVAVVAQDAAQLDDRIGITEQQVIRLGRELLMVSLGFVIALAVAVTAGAFALVQSGDMADMRDRQFVTDTQHVSAESRLRAMACDLGRLALGSYSAQSRDTYPGGPAMYDTAITAIKLRMTDQCGIM
jgi:hypothetical protein